MEYQPLTPSIRALNTGERTVLMKRLAGLEVLAADGRGVLLGQFEHGREVDCEVRCAVGKGNALLQCGVGVDHGGRDADVVRLEAFFEGCDGLVHGCGLKKDFGRAAPDHDDAVYGLFEGPDVFAHLLGEIALVLALFHVGAVQPLDVVLVEDGGQRLDGFEVRLDLLQRVLVEHLGVAGGFVDVVFEDVPSGEDDVLKLGQWDEVVN